MSLLAQSGKASPIILRIISPIPFGPIPGFLSSGISLQANKASRLSESPLQFVYMILVKRAMDLLRSVADFTSKILLPSILRHSSASKPNTPAALLALIQACNISLLSLLSNIASFTVYLFISTLKEANCTLKI